MGDKLKVVGMVMSIVGMKVGEMVSQHIICFPTRYTNKALI